jgi:molybdopterin-guanine dinucleotide biosynthesis protein A
MEHLPLKKNAKFETSEGFILVGGASRRMGTDKSQLRLNDQSFVTRIASALSPVTTKVTLVGRESRDTGSNLPQIQDIQKNLGALGGIHTALSACGEIWSAVVACDMPLVTAELFTYLASLRDDYQAVVPIQSDSRPQPLCAMYKVAPCLKEAERLIRAGERRPLTLIQCVGTRWVPFSELLHLKDAERLLMNVNTPQDFALAQDKIQSTSAFSQ